MLRNLKIMFVISYKITPLGIEIVIKVKNLTRTKFLAKQWCRKISQVFVNRNFCKIINLINTIFKITKSI